MRLAAASARQNAHGKSGPGPTSEVMDRGMVRSFHVGYRRECLSMRHVSGRDSWSLWAHPGASAAGRHERRLAEVSRHMTDLDKLLTERECERLIQLYCHWTDHGEAARVADLFTEDGVWASADNTMNGRESIRRGFQARQANTRRMSRHICTGALIDVIDADNASGVVYLTLYRHDAEAGRTTSPTQAPSMIGEYRDRFVRTAAGWRIQRREIHISFIGGDKVYAGEV